ncbi:sterol desaturase family protein [Chitinophaga sp. Mgbs1]|uniref:Sterol desaturase family protein n=1 Tax=Chitinophaga solisilvae TaxID=1233460 RepID=A0A3S1CT45_9BACT|nr:sterol desaturase family protein [Chitinophaga solisilvae]
MSNALEILLSELKGPYRTIVLGSVFIEWIILIIARRIESNKSGLINILCYVIELIPYLFFGRIVIFGIMLWSYNHRFLTLGFEWYIWVLAYLVYDFMLWFVHLIGHKVRFFWCIHGVHHTAEEMKLSVTIRGSFLGFLHSPLSIVFLPILGFNPFMILLLDLIRRLYVLYEHASEYMDSFVGKLTWLEKIFITPSLHRVHHAKNFIYLDRNYGETFSVWDRIFKTFQPELHDVRPVYGIISDKINSRNFFQVQLQLWKDLWSDIVRAPRLTDKIKYIIMPPGWNHIDGGKMASAYRLEAEKARQPAVSTERHPAPSDQKIQPQDLI